MLFILKFLTISIIGYFTVALGLILSQKPESTVPEKGEGLSLEHAAKQNYSNLPEPEFYPTRDGKPAIIRDDRQIEDLAVGKETQVLFCIRPENISLASGEKSTTHQTIQCPIKATEPTGSDLFVMIELGGKEVMVCMDADAGVEAGQITSLTFDTAKACYFSAQTGLRLNLKI